MNRDQFVKDDGVTSCRAEAEPRPQLLRTQDLLSHAEEILQAEGRAGTRTQNGLSLSDLD